MLSNHLVVVVAASFFSRMKSRAAQAKTGMARVVTARAIVVSEEVTRATPVKTGVMRSNWVLGRSISTSVRSAYTPYRDYNPGPWEQVERAEETGPNYSSATALQKISVSTYLDPLVPLILSNPVPYIGEVNNGTAKQTPVGFVLRGVRRGEKRRLGIKSIFGKSPIVKGR